MDTILAKDADFGNEYQSKTGIIVQVWKKNFTTDKIVDQVLIFVPSSERIINIPSDYPLTCDNKSKIPLSDSKLRIFNGKALRAYESDQAFRLGNIINRRNEKKNKEDVKMEETTQVGKTKKELRGDLKSQIRQYKDERVNLSNRVKEVRTQLKTLKTRVEKRPLIDEMKASTAKRKELSGQIKSLFAEFKNI